MSIIDSVKKYMLRCFVSIGPCPCHLYYFLRLEIDTIVYLQSYNIKYILMSFKCSFPQTHWYYLDNVTKYCSYPYWYQITKNFCLYIEINCLFIIKIKHSNNPFNLWRLWKKASSHVISLASGMLFRYSEETEKYPLLFTALFVVIVWSSF